MSNVEKYVNDDGKVAVLYSPGWGAGWSTWAPSVESFMCMDAGLVQLALEGATESEVQDYLEDALDEVSRPYTGGWRDISVAYLDKGTSFVIEEYDGSESIRTVESLSMTT